MRCIATRGIIPNIVHVAQPYAFERRLQTGEPVDMEALGKEIAQSIADKIEQIGPDRVAAFIAEPIQGAGGVIIPPESYWPEVKKIVEHYGILLVADEVICGFGRTGEWFGSDYYDLKPDLMPMAKGITSGYLPVGAVMVGDRVANTLIHEGGEYNHGFTYSGHPRAPLALANIRLMQRENIVDKVKNDTGPYLQKKIREFGEHPSLAKRGVLACWVRWNWQHKKTPQRFHKDEHAGTVCRDFCFENGLVMRAVGDAMIVSPPLILSRSEIDKYVNLGLEEF